MSAPALGRLRIALAALAVAAVSWSLLGVTDAAQAHEQLLESTPAKGEALDAPPDEVSLRFANDLLAVGGAILVLDESEQPWTQGDLVYDGTTVSIALASGMPDGRYEIRWQVVSEDGHPISGIVPFTVGEVAAEPTPAESGTAAVEAAAGRDDGDASPTAGVDAPRLILVGLVGAAIALVGFALALSSRRRGDASPGTTERGSA